MSEKEEEVGILVLLHTKAVARCEYTTVLYGIGVWCCAIIINYNKHGRDGLMAPNYLFYRYIYRYACKVNSCITA